MSLSSYLRAFEQDLTAIAIEEKSTTWDFLSSRNDWIGFIRNAILMIDDADGDL